MDYLEDFTKEQKPYTWIDIVFGIIFFHVILPLFLLKRLYDKVGGMETKRI